MVLTRPQSRYIPHPNDYTCQKCNGIFAARAIEHEIDHGEGVGIQTLTEGYDCAFCGGWGWCHSCGAPDWQAHNDGCGHLKLIREGSWDHTRLKPAPGYEPEGYSVRYRRLHSGASWRRPRAQSRAAKIGGGPVYPPDYVETRHNADLVHPTAIEVVPLQTGEVATRPVPIGKLGQHWFVGPQDTRPEAWIRDDAGWAQRAWEAQAQRVEQALLRAAG